ncbi:hypothetical protein B0H11DRAFT_1941650 [Mycena galericulata]|nr:hypothetical protein B0H11DRAFT_1941650 [Mycena galericulata]
MLKLKKARRLIPSESTKSGMCGQLLVELGTIKKHRLRRDPIKHDVAYLSAAGRRISDIRHETPPAGKIPRPLQGKFALKAKTDQHQAYAMDSSRQLETALFENAYASQFETRNPFLKVQQDDRGVGMAMRQSAFATA